MKMLNQEKANRDARTPAWRWAAGLSLTLAAATVYAQSSGPARAGSTPGAAISAAQKVALPVSGQYALKLTATPTRVAVADPTVADIKILPPAANRGGEILLLGKKAGTTRVQVWMRGSREPQIWDVQVMGAVQAALDAAGQPLQASVVAAGDRGVLTGQSRDVLSHQNAVNAAAAAVGKDAKSVVDASTVGVGGVVQVDVKVVEVSRSTLKNLGISYRAAGGNWNGGVALPNTNLATAASGLLESGFSLLYSGSKHFSASLGLLESNGMARVLAEPSLVALSGQSASFLAGGELPVPTAGGLGTQNIEYKPFGIGLTVSPTVISRDRIVLKVAPEASEIDAANGIPIVNGDTVTLIPALRTRRADTTVELGDGESFIISGLVSRQTKANVNKVPFLGDLPIIGSFFRNIQYSQDERELIIVVTPHLVRPIARGVALPLPGERQEVANRASTAWGYYLLGPVGGQQMPGFSR